MLRLVTIFLLVLLTQFPLIFKLGVAIEWNINRDYIAQNLCINKNNPEIHCDGKCQFRKWMETIRKQENPVQRDFPYQQIEKYQFSPYENFENKASINSIELTSLSKMRYSYQSLISAKLIFDIFIPPRFLQTHLLFYQNYLY